MIVRFIDENKDRFGVEPMCAQLAGLGCAFAPSTYYDARHRPRSRRAIRDEYLMYYICCFSLCERAAAQRGRWFTWSGYMLSPPFGRRGSSGEAGAVVGPARAGLVAAAPV